MDPPGSLCTFQAIAEIVRRIQARTFLEVGCGSGELSKRLCKQGLTGIGIDFSPQAVFQASSTLQPEIEKGDYKLIQSDFSKMQAPQWSVDVALSIMVMEHIDDDVQFLRHLSQAVRPGGHLLIGVPGRKDRWSVEDETVGHLRRYDKWDLADTFRKAGISDVHVISVAVPIANLLFSIGNFLISKSAEVDKVGLPLIMQTQASGVREIPFKTVFPRFTRLILNQFTLAPVFWLQRLFYKSNLGLVQIAVGRVN